MKVLHPFIVLFLGFRLSASGKEKKREINKDICHIPGFQALQYLLPGHAETPELYFLLMTLLLGQPVKTLPERIQVQINNLITHSYEQQNSKLFTQSVHQAQYFFQFDLDSMWTYIYGVPANQRVPSNNAKGDLNVEAACVVLAMIRAMLNQVNILIRKKIMKTFVSSCKQEVVLLFKFVICRINISFIVLYK